MDLLKCFNPLWLRIGLEAVYGQIIHIIPGSHDLDGLGWFIRKNLFNNDFIKQKFTKTNVLQVNLPTYNVKKNIRNLIYFLLKKNMVYIADRYEKIHLEKNIYACIFFGPC